MAVVACLSGLNLFSSFPSKPPCTDPPPENSKYPPSLPIPIPKYPPKTPKSKNLKPLLKSGKFFPKPVSDGAISSDGERSVVIGESGVSYFLPGAPFEFQYSYSETPNVKPLAIREPAFLPFAPPTMPRPWTGKPPLKKSTKKIRLFEPLNPPSEDIEGAKLLQTQKAISMGNRLQKTKTREEIQGEPLTKDEIKVLIKPLINSNRQVNLGRDGLTHNMLEMIHTHWRSRPVCKVRCKGVPTVDMKNVSRHLEEKTDGKVISISGGVVYLFRGRNYDRFSRPRFPLMLWKPSAPVYPKLIQEAPEGLTKDEADKLRMKGKQLSPICKNGVYISLVDDVRNAFEESPLVKIDCTGMKPTDYKKMGAKLKELVPCVLLSFDDEQILVWRGNGWKSMYRLSASLHDRHGVTDFEISANPAADSKAARSDSRLVILWKQATDSSKALLLDDMNLSPDALLERVEEFHAISEAAAAAAAGEDNYSQSAGQEFPSQEHEEEGEFEADYMLENERFEEMDSTVPYGSLPVDAIAKQPRESSEL